jgi:hypothetical protein
MKERPYSFSFILHPSVFRLVLTFPRPVVFNQERHTEVAPPDVSWRGRARAP